MPTYRLDVSLPYFTNIPRDVAVNTFHITRITDLTETEMEDVSQAVIDFYNEDGSTAAIGEYISPVVQRTSDACSVTWYDLSDPEPRPPVHVETFTLVSGGSTSSMPLEFAATLSVHGTFPAGESRARRRGRLFLGPLTAGALASGSSSTFPRLLDAFRTNCLVSAGALRIAVPAAAPLAFWSVWSRANQEPVEIVGGWMDDAPDTQRRRGQDPTSRWTWPL